MVLLHAGVSLWQEYVLLLFLFKIHMNWIDSSVELMSVSLVKDAKTSWLVFANDHVSHLMGPQTIPLHAVWAVLGK